MNITLLINRDLASHVALSRLIILLSGHKLAIFISEKVGQEQRFIAALIALGTFEQRMIAASGHSFDDLAARANGTLQGFADLGNKVNSAEGIARTNASEPDVTLSIRFGLIIHELVIAIPRHGVINLHSGVLPAYRGVMASFRAMLEGDSDIGSTAHWIQNRGVDTGDILSIAKIRLNTQHSYLFNVLNLYIAGCDQLASAVQQLDAGVVPKVQPQRGVFAYHSFPSEQELAAFFAMGYRLYDPSEIPTIQTLQAAKPYLKNDAFNW